jgi:hypothetical protein
MAAYTYLKYVKLEELTPAQRRTMNQQLRKQKREIQTALNLVNSNLTRLSKVKSGSKKKS